ncbi:hypothetical protein JZ751_011721 [Albula glossodonta]|uniref:Uncharacterized protein n=1 Tax=Albula glossodonta TaxID=121402 RepID=A0A8T2PQL9_9TELE|nr:hypothetical protein JZ751_011721 [Albula glossodonta]
MKTNQGPSKADRPSPGPMNWSLPVKQQREGAALTVPQFHSSPTAQWDSLTRYNRYPKDRLKAKSAGSGHAGRSSSGSGERRSGPKPHMKETDVPRPPVLRSVCFSAGHAGRGNTRGSVLKDSAAGIHTSRLSCPAKAPEDSRAWVAHVNKWKRTCRDQVGGNQSSWGRAVNAFGQSASRWLDLTQCHKIKRRSHIVRHLCDSHHAIPDHCFAIDGCAVKASSKPHIAPQGQSQASNPCQRSLGTKLGVGGGDENSEELDTLRDLDRCCGCRRIDSSLPYLTDPLALIRTLLVPCTLFTPIISARRGEARRGKASRSANAKRARGKKEGKYARGSTLLLLPPLPVEGVVVVWGGGGQERVSAGSLAVATAISRNTLPLPSQTHSCLLQHRHATVFLIQTDSSITERVRVREREREGEAEEEEEDACTTHPPHHPPKPTHPQLRKEPIAADEKAEGSCEMAGWTGAELGGDSSPGRERSHPPRRSTDGRVKAFQSSGGKHLETCASTSVPEQAGLSDCLLRGVERLSVIPSLRWGTGVPFGPEGWISAMPCCLAARTTTLLTVQLLQSASSAQTTFPCSSLPDPCNEPLTYRQGVHWARSIIKGRPYYTL